ncbi:MAG: ECF-type sigma factor [Steroidobacteraceae bacterium]|jgi:RNA polymerase sigma factor (TIGR02999 family)
MRVRLRTDRRFDTLNPPGGRMESELLVSSEQHPDATESVTHSRLFASLYGELRQLAERQLRRNAGVPVSPTTLLHEAYLGMRGRDAVFPDRERFIGYAARVMRGLIIDFVRERRALKRGGDFHITQLPTEVPELDKDETDLSRLSEALDELAVRDAKLAELVDLKYFCGYTFDEIAAQRGTSARTVKRDWEKARTLLLHQLKGIFHSEGAFRSSDDQ